MRANNNTSPAFGTKFTIGVSQQGKLEQLPKKVLDGFILTGADITKNNIKDELVLGVSREKQGRRSDNNLLKTLNLTWFSPDGKDIKQKNIKLKELKNKTAVQVKKFLQAALEQFQPKELRAKAIQPEKLNSKTVLKHADLSVQLAPERIQAAQEGRKIPKEAEKAFYLVSKYGVDDIQTGA